MTQKSRLANTKKNKKICILKNIQIFKLKTKRVRNAHRKLLDKKK